MLGLEIFVHSVKMVLRNLKQVLQITLGPALITSGSLIGLVVLFGIPLDAIDPETGQIPLDEAPFSLILFLCVSIVLVWIAMFWIAVSWHRFILLEEYPKGFFPRFRFDRIIAYLGRVLILGLLTIIAFFPMAFLLSALVPALGGFSVAIVFCYFIVLLIFLLRLAIVLPSVAIGKPLSLSDAWQRTSGSSISVFVLLVVATVFQILIQLISYIIVLIPVVGVFAVIFISMLVLPLINVSILTTMYGVFIEKRELS